MKYKVLIPTTGEMTKPIQAFANSLPEAREVAKSYLIFVGSGHTATISEIQETPRLTITRTSDQDGKAIFVQETLDKVKVLP